MDHLVTSPPPCGHELLNGNGGDTHRQISVADYARFEDAHEGVEQGGAVLGEATLRTAFGFAPRR